MQFKLHYHYEYHYEYDLLLYFDLLSLSFDLLLFCSEKPEGRSARNAIVKLGSMMGPSALFLIYTNDLPKSVTLLICILMTTLLYLTTKIGTAF